MTMSVSGLLGWSFWAPHGPQEGRSEWPAPAASPGVRISDVARPALQRQELDSSSGRRKGAGWLRRAGPDVRLRGMCPKPGLGKIPKPPTWIRFFIPQNCKVSGLHKHN